MKLRILLACLLLCMPLYAATWYATNSTSNISTVTWVPTTTGSCTGSGTALVWADRAAGDIFNANGCTAISINVDPGVASVNVTLTTDTTNGGGFTYATATNITLHVDIIATKTTALTVSGTTGGGTIVGNLTGGSVANQNGVADSHSSVTMTYTGGTFQGGSNSSANGLSVGSTSAGTTNISGTAIGGSGASAYGIVETAASGTQVTTFTGTCQGSATVGSAAGCAGTSAVPLRVVGSIVSSPRAIGVLGAIIFTPAATDYALFAKDTSYATGTIDTHATEMPTNPGVANVASGTTYGSFTGTLSVGGSSAAACSGSWQ